MVISFNYITVFYYKFAISAIKSQTNVANNNKYIYEEMVMSY